MMNLTRVVCYFLMISAVSDAAFGKGQLAIRPQQAFSDARQVALATAAENGDTKAIGRAVEEGADVKAVGGRKATALWYAAVSEQKTAFEQLLKLGADPNTPNETGESLVGWCVLNRDAQFLKLALAHGGNPNAVNIDNGLPVMFRAVSQDSTEKLELLLNAGADINIRARDGSTPALFASSARRMEKLLFLLQRGADPMVRNDVGNDIAAGIFSPNWGVKTEAYKFRQRVLEFLESRNIKADPKIMELAEIRNLGEATGKEPPMWLKSDLKDPNPEWVKANPEKAEKWYQAVRRRPAPRL